MDFCDYSFLYIILKNKQSIITLEHSFLLSQISHYFRSIMLLLFFGCLKRKPIITLEHSFLQPLTNYHLCRMMQSYYVGLRRGLYMRLRTPDFHSNQVKAIRLHFCKLLCYLSRVYNCFVFEPQTKKFDSIELLHHNFFLHL